MSDTDESYINMLQQRIAELEAENKMLRQLAKAEAMAAVRTEQPDTDKLKAHACAFAEYVTSSPLVKHSYTNFMAKIEESTHE